MLKRTNGQLAECRVLPFLSKYLSKYSQIVKFVLSGGASNLLNLFLLFVLTDILGVWYLLSSSLAIVASFAVSFGLQKFWTFQDKNKELNRVVRQLWLYALVFAADFVFNAVLMYSLVDWLHFWYMIAQVLTSGLIAVFNYFVYKSFIFNRSDLV